MKPWILGINASHNGSYCLLEGTTLRVAIQEERLLGLKRARVYGGRHSLGLRYCLNAVGIRASDLAMVVLSSQRSSRAVENDLWMNPDLSGLTNLRRLIVSHHRAHAASAWATAGFSSAAVLVMDGLGSPVEDLNRDAQAVILGRRDGTWEHLSLWRARGTALIPLEIQACEQWVDKDPCGLWRFFSLGGLFSAVAEQIFGDPSEAGKVMGLAAYGKPTIPVGEFLVFDGPRLLFPNLVQRRYRYKDRWPNRARSYRDLAASSQRALEHAVLLVANRLQEITGETNLCLAGGVALNSVANQKICERTKFNNVYILPASEDSGVAIGAAYLGLWELAGARSRRQLRTDGHGRPATSDEIDKAIHDVPDVVASRPSDLLEQVAQRLHQGQIGGWFQGGSELGPRALGQRSIVCSPCDPRMKHRLNACVKFRENFRPFAPSVLAEHLTDWFEPRTSSVESPFMLRVLPFRAEVRSRVPAVVHADGSGRVQTLTARDNGKFYDLVARFHEITAIPMLVNTSMNVHGEPIVERPIDALWCLLGTGLDFCVLHDWLVTKRNHFRTILDYVPGIVARGYKLQMNVRQRALQTTIEGDDAVNMQVSTPWGEADVALPLRLLPLLAKIDGRRHGHALRRALPGPPRARQIIQDLLLLRRMHIVTLLSDE